MLHLILGNAGTGKSTLLTERIERDVAQGRRAYLIIPEQQANLSERTMLPRLPEKAGLTFAITGFTRLYDRVASRYGGISASSPDRALHLLLLWQCLRELSPVLEEYGSQNDTVAPDGALISLLHRTLEELRACNVSPDMLDNAAARLPADTALRPKLRDLALLYSVSDARIAAATGTDGSDELTRLAALLERNDYFSGSHIYIDSFTSFTAEEYAVLRHLLRQAADVTVTLACDALNSSDPSVESICDTANRLIRLSNRENVPVKLEQLTKNHRTDAPELRILERDLWNLSLTPEQRVIPEPHERGNVTALRCVNVYAEAEAVALHLLHLLHSGIPYGEMAIIVRDTAAYRGVLDAALERHGIPFYFSDKSALAEKPLSRLLLSALRAVSYRWQARDILTMLKTGLCPVSAADADLFEQYVDTWSLNGADFVSERWTKNPDGYTQKLSARGKQILDAANRVREAIMAPLLTLYTALHANPSLPACCRAIYEYMEQMQLPARCCAIAEQELTAGYLKEAGETLRIYDTVVDMLTRVSLALPDVTCTPEALSAALAMLFSQTEIASVPSLHDSVTIGAADTLRVENVTACFVLGLCEGDFPAAIKDRTLLSESELKQLSALGIELGSSADLRASEEMMYVRRAVSKPSRYLFLSTLLQDTEGKEKTPSLAYNRALFLLPYLKQSAIAFDLSLLPQAPAATANAADAAPSPTLADTDYTPLAPSPTDLSPSFARALLGDTLYLSQSHIQTFVQCPFRFYTTFLLDLRERKNAALDAADSGTFFHYLLEHFLRDCMQQDGTLKLPAPEEIASLTERIVNRYLRDLLAASVTDAATQARTLHLFRRLRDLASIILQDLLGEFSHSRFLPAAFELHIGGKAPDAPAPYEIELTDGSHIRLSGVVDRVDCYKKDDRVYLRVVDYKSGSKEFALSDIRRGLNVQLFVYLFALCRGGCIPAGAVYLAVKEEKGVPHPTRSGLVLDDDDVLHAMNDTLDPHYLAGTLGKSKAPANITPAAQLAALERELCATLRAIGNDMRCGRAARTPSQDACRYCPLRGHCPDAIPPAR